MIHMRMRGIVLITVGGAMAGCVSIPRHAGFASVQQTVHERSGQHVEWNRGDESEKQIARRVQLLLKKSPLTEDDAVQIALLNNQNLQATYEELGIAQAELVEASLPRNPTISAEVRFPDLPALPYEINLTQSFLDLLLLPIRKRQSEANFQATQLRVTSEVLKTAADTKAAFYRAQGQEQLVEMRRQISEATAAGLEAARALHDAGNINDLDFANQRVMHEQAKVDLAQAQAAALDVREELNALMGLWGKDIDWKMAARLRELPRDEIPPTGLESLAVSQRADLGAAREQVEMAAQALGVSKFAAFSDIGFGAHLQKETDGALTIGPAIDIPLPLFNQGQPAIAAAQARLRQSQARYKALAVEIRGEIRRKRNAMTAARQRAEYYVTIIVPLRHQIVQQSQLHYNAMTIAVFQLLQAKQAEVEAGRDYVQALQEYWVARAELERAVGGKLPAGSVASEVIAAPLDPATQPADVMPHHHHHGEQK